MDSNTASGSNTDHILEHGHMTVAWAMDINVASGDNMTTDIMTMDSNWNTKCGHSHGLRLQHKPWTPLWPLTGTWTRDIHLTLVTTLAMDINMALDHSRTMDFNLTSNCNMGHGYHHGL